MSIRSGIKTMINWKQTIEDTLARENDNDSHTERDLGTFHASQLGKCKRQATISKLGLESHSPETLGNFLAGTLFHEWVEENVEIENLVFETPVIHKETTPQRPEKTLNFVGHADAWDTENNVLYDFKTRGDYFRGGFQYLETPVDRHVDQLHIYMRALEVERGQIVYVDKKNPAHVRTWPEDGLFDFDWERYRDLVRKARDIQKALMAFKDMNGRLPETKEQVPFEKDDCWVCEQE